ncbi:hypothetical protein BH24ACT5_BH24ACT5_09500 [soil metagenome]
MTDDTDGPAAATIVGQLADPGRRRVVAAIELGAGVVSEVVAATGMTNVDVSKALGRLLESGVVVTAPDRRMRVHADAFTTAARQAFTRAPSEEHARAEPRTRRLLEAFIRDGRIVRMPTAAAKRAVVLDWLAQDFEPGRRYPEAEVNEILLAHHDDPAMWRRYLVDNEYLQRRNSVYWRAGGSFESHSTDG